MELDYDFQFFSASLSLLQDSCLSDLDCVSQNSCVSGLCVHKALFPLSLPDILVFFIIFAVSGLANAAGLAGGSVMIPVLILVGGFSTFYTLPMVELIACAGVGVALLYRIRLRHPTINKPRIEYNVALQMIMPLLLGTTYGVMLHRVLPEWFVLVSLVVILSFSTLKMYEKYVLPRASEVEKLDKTKEKELKKALIDTEECDSLLSRETKRLAEDTALLPKKQLGLVGIMYLFIFCSTFLRGGKGFSSLIGIELCTPNYWIFTGFYTVFCIALMFLASRFLVTRRVRHEILGYVLEEEFNWTNSNCFKLVIYGFITGVVAGMLGLPAGAFIAPLLLILGLRPEVAAPTCTFLVFFSCSIAFVQFAMSGLMIYDYGLFYSVAALLGALIGVMMIEKAMRRHRSMGVYILVLVLVLSTVLIAIHGVIRIRDGIAQNKLLMGFREYC